MFEPIFINTTEIPNRFVRSSTQEYMANKDGSMNAKLIDLYKRLAEGEVGLILTGFAYVHSGGISSRNQVGVDGDDRIRGFLSLTRTVHHFDSKIMLQIVHGGRQIKPELCQDPVCPSEVYDPSSGTKPRELTEPEIIMIKDAFVEAIRRAAEAEFDGVELHIAHGYLLEQFISPHTNRRKDDWGGNTKNRCRIITEIIEDARSIVGPEFPIMAKLNSEDGIKGGLTVEESISVAKLLVNTGLDALEISGGIAEAGEFSCRTGIKSPREEAYFASAARKIKDAVDVPVILVGGIRSLGVMEKVINNGTADMISMSRPFICEPDLVTKFKNGLSEKSRCISCSKCFYPRGIRCSQWKEPA